MIKSYKKLVLDDKFKYIKFPSLKNIIDKKLKEIRSAPLGCQFRLLLDLNIAIKQIETYGKTKSTPNPLDGLEVAYIEKFRRSVIEAAGINPFL